MKLCCAFVFCCAMLNAEYVSIAGSRVYYHVSGEGSPAVVLVHGWTCDSTSWRLQSPDLERHFRVLALDLPGHGRSDKPQIEYTLDLFARAVDAAVRASGIERAVYVGHSMGVPVIRQLLATHPTSVIAIVSIDGAVSRSAGSDEFKRWADSLAGPNGAELRRQFIAGMYTAATPPALRESITNMMLAAPPYVAASAMKNSVMSKVWSLPRTGVPVLAINTATAGGRRKQLHEEVFGSLEYHELEGVSHFLHMEKPPEVNRLIIDFIRKVGK